MAKLYFRYGAMGSSKTANALMVAYNYKERGKRALLAKPKLDTREIGVMHSRIDWKSRVSMWKIWLRCQRKIWKRMTVSSWMKRSSVKKVILNFSHIWSMTWRFR